MAVGQAAAAGVDRQMPARRDAAIGDEGPALALFHEAEIFKKQDRVDAKGVVDLHRLHVLGRETGHGIGLRAGDCRTGGGQIRHRTDRHMRQAFADAQHEGRLLAQCFGPRCRGKDDRATAIVDEAAIAHGERVADHAGGEHLGDGERLLLPRHRVEQRPLAGGDRDFGQLFPRGAEFMHMPRGGQRVGGGGQERLIGGFVGVVFARARRRPADAALGAAIGDQRDLTQARLNRRHRVGEVGHERGAADAGAVLIARADAEIFAQAQGWHAQLRGGGEHRIDIGQVQAAIFQRAKGCLGHQIDRGGAGCDLAEIGFRGADHRHTAALHAAAPTTVNTG